MRSLESVLGIIQSAIARGRRSPRTVEHHNTPEQLLIRKPIGPTSLVRMCGCEKLPPGVVDAKVMVFRFATNRMGLYMKLAVLFTILIVFSTTGHAAPDNDGVCKDKVLAAYKEIYKSAADLKVTDIRFAGTDGRVEAYELDIKSSTIPGNPTFVVHAIVDHKSCEVSDGLD